MPGGHLRFQPAQIFFSDHRAHSSYSLQSFWFQNQSSCHSLWATNTSHTAQVKDLHNVTQIRHCRLFTHPTSCMYKSTHKAVPSGDYANVPQHSAVGMEWGCCGGMAGHFLRKQPGCLEGHSPAAFETGVDHNEQRVAEQGWYHLKCHSSCGNAVVREGTQVGIMETCLYFNVKWSKIKKEGQVIFCKWHLTS